MPTKKPTLPPADPPNRRSGFYIRPYKVNVAKIASFRMADDKSPYNCGYFVTLGTHTMNHPPCPQCQSELTYHDGSQLVCPECGHEWPEYIDEHTGDTLEVKDANGTALADGDSVILIKDLKVKGSSQIIKQGTKVKNIRLQEGDHDIACKIDGSAMNLKSQFVKKA